MGEKWRHPEEATGEAKAMEGQECPKASQGGEARRQTDISYSSTFLIAYDVGTI